MTKRLKAILLATVSVLLCAAILIGGYILRPNTVYGFDPEDYLTLCDLEEPPFTAPEGLLDQRAKEELDLILKKYKGQKKRGTVLPLEEGDVAKIYYTGRRVLYEGTVLLSDLEKASDPLSKRLVEAVKKQSAFITYNLPQNNEDLTVPFFVKDDPYYSEGFQNLDAIYHEMPERKVTQISITYYTTSLENSSSSSTGSLKIRWSFTSTSVSYLEEEYDLPYDLILGEGTDIPEFEQLFLGKSPQKLLNSEASIVFPLDYSNQNRKGKHYIFTIDALDPYTTYEFDPYTQWQELKDEANKYNTGGIPCESAEEFLKEAKRYHAERLAEEMLVLRSTVKKKDIPGFEDFLQKSPFVRMYATEEERRDAYKADLLLYLFARQENAYRMSDRMYRRAYYYPDYFRGYVVTVEEDPPTEVTATRSPFYDDFVIIDYKETIGKEQVKHQLIINNMRNELANRLLGDA